MGVQNNFSLPALSHSANPKSLNPLPWGHRLICGQVIGWTDLAITGGSAATLTGIVLSHYYPNQYAIQVATAVSYFVTNALGYYKTRQSNQIPALHAEISLLGKKDLNIQLTAQKAEENIEELSKQIKSLITENELFQKESVELKQNYIKLQLIHSQFEKEHEDFKDMYRSLRQSNKKIKLQIIQLQAVIKSLKEEIVKLTNENQLLRKSLNQAKQAVMGFNKDNNNFEKTIEDIKQQNRDDMSILAKEVQTAAHLSKDVIESFTEQNNVIRSEIERISLIIKDVDSSHSNLKEEAHKIEVLTEKEEKKEETWGQFHQDISNENKNLQRHTRNLSAEMDHLINLQKNWEGEEQEVVTNTTNLANIVTSLSSLAKRFEVALQSSEELEKKISIKHQTLEGLQ
jgi:chromosome segregation ATPase